MSLEVGEHSKEASVRVCLVLKPLLWYPLLTIAGKMMQLSGSTTVMMDIYRQDLLTTLVAEREFSKNKHLLKLSQALGQQFWLKSRAAKPVLLLM